MIVPVIFDAHQMLSSPAPSLGQHARFELVWTARYAEMWAGLRPGWTVRAALQYADRPRVTHLGTTEEDDTERQPMIGAVGGLRFRYNSALPIQDSLHIEGALRITAVETWAQAAGEAPVAQRDSPEPDWITTGTVRRLQLVSILVDMRPTLHPGWAGMAPVAGTEWFYDLASPPAQLHHYRPPADSDQESSIPSSFAIREELLLLDLEVDS